MGMSRTAALARAMESLSVQIDSIVESMFTSSTNAELPTMVTRVISNTRISGAQVIDEDFIDGQYWIVVALAVGSLFEILEAAAFAGDYYEPGGYEGSGEYEDAYYHMYGEAED